MNAIEATLHLRERMKVVGDATKQPHWTKSDAAAVLVLLDRPAMPEQIALARIEGLTHNGYAVDTKHIHLISRRALGLPT